MYLLHRLITTGVFQLSDLEVGCETLLSGAENRENALVHCCKLM